MACPNVRGVKCNKGLKLYNDQRNAQVINLFIYLRLPYMFRDSFKSIFRGRCTNSAMVKVSWLWC
jgi:hypothetical protein